MNRSNDERWFEQAVRHLFRHLGKTHVLKHNPLVAHFFEVARPTRRPDPETLADIRGSISSAADQCLTEDFSSGLADRAKRQHEILVSILNNIPIEQVQASLALSSRQYYRDRRAICTRVARIIMQKGTVQTTVREVCEPLDIALRRASALIDLGFYDQASREFEEILFRADSQFAKSSALLGLCDAALSLGNLEACASSLAAAQSILNRSGVSPQLEALADKALLMSILLERALGRDDTARALLASIGDVCEACRAGEKKPNPALLRIELLNYQMSLERYERDGTQRHAERATSIARSLGDSGIDHAKLAVLASYSQDENAPADVRTMSANQALDNCLSVGYTDGVISSLLRLATVNASDGNEEEALKHSRRALRVAESIDGYEAMLTAAVNSSGALLKTRFWQALNPLVFNVEKFARKKSLPWLMLKRCQGELLRNEGKNLEAINPLLEAEAAIGSYQESIVHVAVLRELSISYQCAGKRAKAIKYMNSAIALGEGLTDASSTFLYTLYSAADIMVPCSRFRQQVKRLRSHLASDRRAACDRKLTRIQRLGRLSS